MQLLEVLKLFPDGHIFVGLQQVVQIVAAVGNLVENRASGLIDFGFVYFEFPYHIAVGHFANDLERFSRIRTELIVDCSWILSESKNEIGLKLGNGGLRNLKNKRVVNRSSGEIKLVASE